MALLAVSLNVSTMPGSDSKRDTKIYGKPKRQFIIDIIRDKRMKKWHHSHAGGVAYREKSRKKSRMWRFRARGMIRRANDTAANTRVYYYIPRPIVPVYCVSHRLEESHDIITSRDLSLCSRDMDGIIDRRASAWRTYRKRLEDTTS